MEALLNSKIKELLKTELGLDDNQIDEAYAASQKQFDIKTDFLSKENITNHIKLYENYLKDFNKVSAKLDVASRVESNGNHSDFRSLKLDEIYNMNGAYFHELYFANIADSASEITTNSLAFMRLNRDFGTFDAWQQDFIACAKSSRCGWVVTYLNVWTQSYMNAMIDLHTENIPAGMYPIIVMDVWQHAYYRDYLKDVTTYNAAMMKQLNWNVIEERFEKADKILSILRS